MESKWLDAEMNVSIFARNGGSSTTNELTKVRKMQIARATKSERIWLFVMDELKRPIAENAAARKIAPMYPPQIGPASGCPKILQAIRYDKVGRSMKRDEISAAKYFPRTTSRLVTGSVIKVSREPLFFSSENSLIVMAGMKRLNSTGRFWKKYRSSARSSRKNVGKNKNPDNRRKHTVTM